jgi:hypothetical protein
MAPDPRDLLADSRRANAAESGLLEMREVALVPSFPASEICLAVNV